MQIIKQIRQVRGLSQRRMAQRASISFKGLQLMERENHDVRLSSLSKIARAFGLPRRGIRQTLERFFALPAESAASTSLWILEDGFNSWRIHLFNFVDAFRRTEDLRLCRNPPAEEVDARIRVLMAATVEALCLEATRKPPRWCDIVDPLPNPWFVAEVESLKASALVESPVSFRKRSIFVLGNFLDRA